MIRYRFHVDEHRAEATLTEELNTGYVFVFRGRRGDRVKILRCSGDGLWLLAKRLERGRFVRPQASSGMVHLTPAQLSMLEGVDRRKPRMHVASDIGLVSR